jgi:hypothetical protein
LGSLAIKYRKKTLYLVCIYPSHSRRFWFKFFHSRSGP